MKGEEGRGNGIKQHIRKDKNKQNENKREQEIH